jgi:hypothetical protein
MFLKTFYGLLRYIFGFRRAAKQARCSGGWVDRGKSTGTKHIRNG